MYYPYYKHADKFIPDSKSMELWKKTRKNKSENKPGIFETTEFSKDQIWSIASIIIEFSALYLTFKGAYKIYLQTGMLNNIWISIAAVFLFVAFDIIGIMLHGHDKAQRNLDRSRYLVERDPNEKLIIFNRLKETTMREFFGVLLLSVSAVLKIAALGYFFQDSSIQVLAIFTLFYLIVIYIHAVHTVYWWPALKLKIRIKRQYNQWIILHEKGLPTPTNNTIDSTNIIQYPFISNSSGLSHIISTCENNRVKIIPTSSGNYLLEVTGPLWDENIVNLCSQWGDRGVQDLLHNCIKVQLMQCGIIVN
jgi:hypothetical protein